MTEAEMKATASYMGKDIGEIEKTALDMCPESAEFEKIRPLAFIIAAMFEKSHWAHAGVGFGVDECGIHYFRAGNDYICVSGYNVAYQVKLCTDLLEKQGYFA